MTPRRKTYLAKCGKKEKFLREKIKDKKKTIRNLKRAIQTLPRISIIDSKRKSEMIYAYKKQMKEIKIMLSAYRYKLARLKHRKKVEVCLDKT